MLPFELRSTALESHCYRLPMADDSGHSAAAQEMRLFVEYPADNTARASIILLAEAFGVNSYMRELARCMAKEGYLVLLADVYYFAYPNNTFAYEDVGNAVTCMAKLDDACFARELDAVLNWLDGEEQFASLKRLTLGFCMGGRLSFLSALHQSARLDAAVCYYGGGIAALVDQHADQLSGIGIPLCLFFGEKDDYIPLAEVESISQALISAGTDFDLQVFDGCDHGFFCAERSSFDAAAATESWATVAALLQRIVA